MLWRFSLYGFLKNQRYFEPFLVLALLELGASFVEVGILVAIRELTRNLFEIPSGAAADAWGRRRTMVAAFVAYPLGLVAFLLAPTFWAWALAVGLFGVGDAMRSGTHKAMIFEWLDQEGRSEENTRVYGVTRSWSQIGSAVSIPIAAAIVIVGDAYAVLFWATAIPWGLNLLNLATYPAKLDRGTGSTARAVLRDAWERLRGDRGLRALVGEAMAFQGIYKATKDYVQPALLALVVVLPAWGTGRVDIALVVGVVYMTMHLAGAYAARRAHALTEWTGSKRRASGFVWLGLIASLAVSVGAGFGFGAAAAVGFVGVSILYNAFRPLLVSRVDEATGKQSKATMLSVESQASSVSAVVLAPALGFVADAAGTAPGAADGLWAVAAIGLVVAAPFALKTLRR